METSHKWDRGCFKRLSKLGTGSYGTVWRVSLNQTLQVDKEHCKEYALKEISLLGMSPQVLLLFA